MNFLINLQPTLDFKSFWHYHEECKYGKKNFWGSVLQEWEGSNKR